MPDVPREGEKRHMLGDARVGHMRENFARRNLRQPRKADPSHEFQSHFRASLG